jgi:hypothetical protein
VLRRFRPRLTFANVVSVIALFLALGGGAYAAFHLPKNSVRSKNIVNGQVLGKDVKEATLGVVPRATDAQTLDGQPGSDYRDQCPSGMRQAAHSILCFDVDQRSSTTFTDALKICAGNGGHLPTPGELAVAFDNSSAFQTSQWTTTTWFANTGEAAVTMRQSSTRDITLDADLITASNPYRCVASPSN